MQAVVNLVLCIDCGSHTPAGRFCTWCAAPQRPRVATEKAKKVYAAAHKRIWELMHSARTTTTIKRNQEVWASIAKFMRDEMDTDPLHLAPIDVVCWLIRSDGRARTVFHKPECPDFRAEVGGACDKSLGCSTRLKHAAARTKVMQLRAHFRSMGLTSAWDGRSCTGNPCRAPQIDEYLAALLKEQIACGVHTDLAPLMDAGLVDALVKAHVLLYAQLTQLAREGRGEPMEAYWALQCATVLAFLAHVPDRSFDVARLTFQDVDFLMAGRDGPGTPRALRIRLGLNKTAHKHGKARSVLLLDTEDRLVSPVSLFLQLRSVRAEAGVELVPLVGLLFLPKSNLLDKRGRPVAWQGRQNVKPMSHKQLQAVLSTAQRELGPAYARMPLTPHSFRAAGAARALARGEDVEVILHCFNWRSPAMLAHYVELRALYGYKGPMGATEDLSLDPEDLGEEGDY